MTFQKAKQQSVKFALEVGQLLKQDKLREAIDLAKKYKHSHVAKVLSAGLLEFAYEAHGASIQGHDSVAAAERAVERTAMMVTADLKKGLGGLATIATTAPFIGLLGTVIGIINAFRGMAASGAGGLGSVSAGIAEALVTTALGLFVAIPAVWLYNLFLNKIERFQVEMSNSSSELIDYFMKRQATKAA
jgi:biopolymer transport protein ExbB/biopolymer transport protein TolQ